MAALIIIVVATAAAFGVLFGGFIAICGAFAAWTSTAHSRRLLLHCVT